MRTAYTQRVYQHRVSMPDKEIGARGFEPPTSRTRTVRSTRLSYAPTYYREPRGKRHSPNSAGVNFCQHLPFPAAANGAFDAALVLSVDRRAASAHDWRGNTLARPPLAYSACLGRTASEAPSFSEPDRFWQANAGLACTAASFYTPRAERIQMIETRFAADKRGSRRSDIHTRAINARYINMLSLPARLS